MKLLCNAFLGILLVGCGARRDRSSMNRYENRERDAMTLMIVVDLPGSFLDLMAEDGKAWELTIAAVVKYMRDRAGASQDYQLILANVSVPLLSAVDTAVVGHLPEAYYIGGVAIGAMLFTNIYHLVNCLRMGTTGPTARVSGAGV